LSKYIFFIHGLSGNAEKTWEKFPHFLKQHLGLTYTIDHLEYKSPSKLKFWASAPTLLNIAEAHITKLQSICNLENDEVILIGHSNGGVVIKKLLARLESKKIKHNITKVCFLDVPHLGSGYATAGKVINPRNKHIKSLSLNSPDLVEINDSWLMHDYHKQFDILNLVAEIEDVVAAASSRFCYPNSVVIPGKDHGSIAKPANSSEIVVTKVIEFVENKKSLAKYSTNLSENYRDWIAHDNGRRHGLTFVSDEIRLSDLHSLQEALSCSGSIVRVTGLSGLGKTRLIKEYIENEEEISEKNILVFKATSLEDEIQSNVKNAIRDDAFGLIIIEHCSIELHDYLATEISRYKSSLRLITVNFYDDKVNTSPYIHLTKLDDISVTELIQPLLPQFDGHQISRIVSFVEGYPLLAILIAERFIDEGVLSTELTERGFAEKLINGDKNLSPEHKRILQACCLFDVFGIEADGLEQADFIIQLAKSDRASFGEVINQFEQKRIINRVGRFARVVPKPLAVHLASIWWDNNIHDELENLINRLPESLIPSFCAQVKYLDTSPKVREFVNKLCETCGPFGQAELLFSTKGSKLFRALVEVNPNATNNLLYRVITKSSDDEISRITGDVRRNLVWALEMLVFHKSCFEKASWCLFKLAQFENENYSNNAIGQFAQLFRWQLSGTEADFKQRLILLSKCISLNSKNADLVVIEAIKMAISSRGGSRTIGAEFQGTKPEMKEWRPKIWQDIFDYWNVLFGLLVDLAKKEGLADLVKNAFGHEIRDLIRYEQLDSLDSFINRIITLSGKYWPAASQSITHALHYDLKGLSEKQIDMLNKWENLLLPDPDNLEERLKLVVLDPSREHVEDEEGNYIDIAAEEAISLAKELKTSLVQLTPYLDLLFNFSEQKQSWVFAKVLALESEDENELLLPMLDYLRVTKNAGTQFLSGFLVGLNEKSFDKWNETILLIGDDKQLQEYYSYVIGTGHFNTTHLARFIELIGSGVLPSHSASMLRYGRATEHLTEDEIASFCFSLSKIDPVAAWVALGVINMYMFGRKDYDFKVLKPVVVRLILLVSFTKKDKSRQSDGYHWLKSATHLLESEGSDFAIKLSEHLITQIESNDIDYSDLWDYLHNAFYKAFELHGIDVWPIVAHRFLQSEGMIKYRLVELLGSGKESRKKTNSIFTLLDEDLVIDWCKDEKALFIVARSLSMFDTNNDKTEINSLLVQLITNYGDNKDFLSEISTNYHSRSWSGSLIPYLESDKDIISPLIQHENKKVCNWATEFYDMIDRQIKAESERDAEENMLRNF
jgi:pimeloyl-ACP methyl ester carboxylesterase